MVVSLSALPLEYYFVAMKSKLPAGADVVLVMRARGNDERAPTKCPRRRELAERPTERDIFLLCVDPAPFRAGGSSQGEKARASLI